ncbi:hypothetical protein OG562_36610 [Streptomyces sp. NBC_01275]|uniref:hypothetical protein n=1 Tax=Streptomyces sp. NBC_01275 TaxID=2903807 RepID=UPI002255E0C9|nr:hypothetical protein [Streptomyces sp. NBC_01275]MCX4766400.1 hypothetical protein [Streptomyces sp. NBC_01275]
MSTRMGIGTKYRGYSYPNRDGSHHATQWAVVFDLPVFPLRRHRLTVDGTTHTVHEETPLKGGEILRTFLNWWLLGPLAALGPPALVLWWLSNDEENSGFMPWFLVLGSCAAWAGWAAAALGDRRRLRRGLPK